MINVYHSKETSFSSNGLAKLHECISCIVKEAINGSFELEIEYPSNSKKAVHLKKWNIVKVEDQLFRIYNLELKDDGKQIIKLWARHLSYDLAFFFFEELVFNEESTLVSALSTIAQGTPVNINTLETGLIAFKVSFKEVDRLSALFQFIQLLGYELQRNNLNIEVKNQIGSDHGVLIKYGKNLKGITETINLDTVITRLYPIGANDIYLPEKYLDSPFINHSEYPPYPIIKAVNFDVYDEWTLRITAQAYLSKVDKPKLTYDVDFVELEKCEAYKEYAHLQKVKLGDQVIVRHQHLNLDIKLRVIKYEKDVLKGTSSKITLGEVKESFIDSQLSMFKAKDTVDYAFKKRKLNSATLKGLKVINELTDITTFEITEEGDTIINGKVTIGNNTTFEPGFDPRTKMEQVNLGDLAFEDAVEKSKLGVTIIEGGYLKTGFVDASRIDTGTLNANQVSIEAKDGANNTIIKIGEIAPNRYGLRIKGDNGELMFDEYGIDPRFIKAFKNLIWNSSFERFDPVSKKPNYWTGGEATASSSFDNTRSMKLNAWESSEIEPSAGSVNPRPDPAWWNNERTRISFFKNGGDVQVQVFSEYDFAPFALTDEEGATLNYYNTGTSSNWNEGRYTFSLEPNKPGRIWLRFSNISGSPAYIDAVQMEPDFNGKYPSFYTNGPYSVSADEAPLSDTWLEYINIPYSQAISIEFNQSYSLPPTVTASILRNKNAVNPGSGFGNINIVPNIDLIIQSVNGVLRYTGCHITWGGSAPASISSGYVSVQVIGRV